MDSCPHCGSFRNRGSPFSEVPLYLTSFIAIHHLQCGSLGMELSHLINNAYSDAEHCKNQKVTFTLKLWWTETNNSKSDWRMCWFSNLSCSSANKSRGEWRVGLQGRFDNGQLVEMTIWQFCATLLQSDWFFALFHTRLLQPNTRWVQLYDLVTLAKHISRQLRAFSDPRLFRSRSFAHGANLQLWQANC